MTLAQLHKERRCACMLLAYLSFNARKIDRADREKIAWTYLMEWAMLGGKADEVIQ